MRTLRFAPRFAPWLACAAAVACLGSTSASASVVVAGPLTATQLSSLNGSGAQYGPPSNATFPDGPYVVNSGTSTAVTGGPKASSADSLLFVLTTDDLSSLGSDQILLTFLDLGGTSHDVTFSSGDFYSTSAAGFPSNISGIANGAVNNIKFSDPNAMHAGVDATFGTALTKDATLGHLSVTSPLNLRIDIFGDFNGLIVGNAANSGAEGVDGGKPPSVPEPSALGLMGLGLLALGLVRRKLQAG